jgi:hypothetical protein
MELKKLMQKFHSKILLFGEYSIIQNSMGLSIPFNQYEGMMDFADLKTEVYANFMCISGANSFWASCWPTWI